jgi:predicted DNA-binding protein
MANISKDKMLNIRVSTEEYEILQQKAKNNEMQISTYIREKIFFDIPHLEKYSFEYKALKDISYLVGAMAIISQDQKEDVVKEAKRIMGINGIETD